jgi:cytoskeleton-associated protein 5
LHSTDIEAKTQRAKRDGTRWSSDTTNAGHLLETLQKQMEPHCSPEHMGLLFSVDRNAEKDHYAGLAQLEEFYDQTTPASRYGLADDTLRDIRLANVDIALKYTSVRLRDGSTQMVLKCLDLVQRIVETVDRTAQSGFTDAESNILLPALISKVSPESSGFPRVNKC